MAFLFHVTSFFVVTLAIIAINLANGQELILIGQPCNDNAQCVGRPNSECTGICNCGPGFTANLQLDDCLLIQNQLGGSCLESQQCQRGDPGPESFCDNGRCRCRADFINPAGENKCYPKALKINDTCERDVQCLANLEHALCLNGKCSCVSDAVEGLNGTKCLRKMLLWGTCLEQGQCDHITNSVCTPAIGTGLTHSECRCRTGNETFVPNPNDRLRRCMKMAVYLGESCQDHEYQCNPVRYSRCDLTTHTCQCRDEDQVPSLDKRNCYPKLESLNSSCAESQQCQKIENSECRAGACLCKEGFVESIKTPNRCLPVGTKIGDQCQENVQCAAIAYDGSVGCDNTGYCNCNRTIPPSQFYNGRCTLPTQLGHPCDSHTECHVGINNLTACVLKEGSMPPERWCACLPNTIRLYETCWATKRIGEDCSMSLECAMSITGPVSCNEATKKCTCATDYVSGNSEMSCVNGGNSLKHGVNGFILSFIVFLFMTVHFEKL